MTPAEQLLNEVEAHIEAFFAQNISSEYVFHDLGHTLQTVAATKTIGEGFHLNAKDMLTVVLESAIQYPTSFAKWLCAADFALGPTRQVALLGDPQHPQTQALLAVLWKNYQPRQVAAISNYPPAQDSPALLKDRPLLKAQPTAYVCQGFVCQQPVNTPGDLAMQLANT